MASAAWGIDIGNRALKAVKLQRTAEGVKMTDFAAIEHDTILSEAGDNREELVQTALAKFVSRHDTRKTAVAVSVTGQQSFARFVKLPPVEPRKIPEIVRFEAVQQIPFPLDDVEWSYQLFEREDDPDVEVGIFAMRKELVNSHVQTFVNAELDVLAVQTNPLAVYNAVRNDARLDKGHAVILDLGAESTDMIVADNDSIWMRSLDVGGNAFTQALAKAFKIDFEKAEEMKRGAKASKYAKQIYQAMRPVFGELVGEVQRSLGFYQSGHSGVEVRKIIALGGGFKLNGLSGYLQKNLQMPVEKPQRFNVPGPDDASAAAALAENTLSGTCAYGLALQALGDAAITSSLLPTHIRQDKMWRDKTKFFVAAGVMGVAAAMIALASLLLNEGALSRGQNAQNQIKTIKDTANRLGTEWQSVAGGGVAELQIVRNVNTLRDGMSYWPGLSADLLTALPGPRGDVAAALAGQLGDPTTYDEADKAAVVATPRAQRTFVQLHEMQSVYTDDVGALVDNASVFYTNARLVLSGSRPRSGAADGADAGFGDLSAAAGGGAEGGPRRGFIIKLVLLTPASVEGRPSVYDLLGDAGSESLRQRLEQLAPSAERPDLPYKISLASMSDAQPLKDSPEVLESLRERYEARQAVLAPEPEETGPVDPRSPRDPRDGRRNPMGDFGGGEFSNPGGSFSQPRQPARFNNRPGRNTGPVSADDPSLLDPVTGESMINDSVIEVLLAVQLDPPAYKPPTPETELGDDAGFNGEVASVE